MDQPKDHLPEIMAAIRELDFTPAADDTQVFGNKALGYNFKLTRTPAPSIQVRIVQRTPDGFWSEYRTGSSTSILLVLDCVEVFKGWLRQHHYPVDRILRRKRLRALID